MDNTFSAAPRQSKSRVVFVAVVVVLLVGGVVLYNLGQSRPGWTMRGIGLGPGGIVKTSGGRFGPVAIELDQRLRETGLTAKYLSTAGKSESGLFYRTETHTIRFQLTAAETPLDGEGFSYQVFGEQDELLDEGNLVLSTAPKKGESVDVQVEIVLKGDQGPPARLVIGK